MFSLSIAVGRTQPIVWTLMFRTKKAADDAIDVLRTSAGDCVVTITDEFGQTFDSARSDIVASMFEDLEQSRLAHVERTLQVELIKAAAITRMRGNPAFNSLTGAGPPMLQPMMNGMGR